MNIYLIRHGETDWNHVGHGAILYAVVTAITDGRIEYGGKMVSFNQGSIYRIRCEDDALQVARYSEEESGFKEVIKLKK